MYEVKFEADCFYLARLAPLWCFIKNTWRIWRLKSDGFIIVATNFVGVGSKTLVQARRAQLFWIFSFIQLIVLLLNCTTTLPLGWVN